MPTGTVTFLLSDVAGSTRLWEAGEDAAAAAIERHYELLDAAISAHGGVRPVEQGEGDSVVAAFAFASDAVAAALDAQRAFAAERWPTDPGVQVRIALHSGEARLRDEGNYIGPAIIRCARLRAIAHGGQTLLSEATRDLVVDTLTDDVTLRHLGSHRLKDLGRPERVWQLCHADLDVDFPPLRSLDAFPNNLRAQLTAFVGRDAEIGSLHDVLTRARLVTLTGVGGCGKTRLALQLAAEVVERHAGGTWWVELAAVSDPELVPAAIANVVGVRAEPDRSLVETLSEYLLGQHALIVLDNCEQVLGASAGVTEQLLERVPDLVVVATSREPLGIAGEVAWRVPSLATEGGVRLFVDRAAQVRPGFRPDDAEVEVIAAICERLDGLPLAIELAAARTRMMRPAGIAAALQDRFRLLTGASRTVVPRQQTLEASVSWSHDLLDEAERVLFRRLSVFSAGFTLDAAEAVCADDQVDSYAVLDLLGRLVDKSLVQVDDFTPETRYRMLETIRHYARGRLLESGEPDTLRSRHLSWFLAYAELAEPELAAKDGPAWLARLDFEHDNLQAALEWAETTGGHDSVLRLVGALSLFWELRGHRHQGVGGRWFARALAVDNGPSVARARALWAAAHMGIYGGDAATTVLRAPEALAVAEAVGDQRTIARARNTLSYVRANFAPQAALAALTESIELARSIGDDWAVGDGLKMTTIAWGARGDYDGLTNAARELLDVAVRLGNKFFIAWYHTMIGYVAAHRGDFAAARDQLETSIALCDEVGDPITKWLAMCFLGEVDALTGEYEAAQARYEQVLTRGVASDGDLARHWAVPDLGALLLGRGDIAGAARIIEPAVAAFEGEGPFIRPPFLCVYGTLLLASGDEVGPRAAFDEAKDVASRIDNPLLVSMADHHLGQLARRQGQTQRAEDLHHEALALRHAYGLLPGVVESIEALGGLAADQESAAEAVRLFAAAAAIRDSIGLARCPADETLNAEDLGRAGQQLDSDTFAAAWAEGESLTVDETVAYASRARGERKRPSSGWASLTPTELEVVKLTAKGLTNPEIGERLFIGRGTVKTHLAHIFTKLGIKSRAELASEATRRGM
jgi:predicted ATPase/class 3 adenylate cyclase/DNA-binding CsgD family transcriptional regulator